jgi:hypothetical protein
MDSLTKKRLHYWLKKRFSDYEFLSDEYKDLCINELAEIKVITTRNEYVERFIHMDTFVKILSELSGNNDYEDIELDAILCCSWKRDTKNISWEIEGF